MSEKETFWENFFSSTSLTPSLDVRLIGDSGISHRFPAIGTGDVSTDKRMVLITTEPDPIKAQLVGFDIQRKYPSERVILSRPHIANTKQVIAKFAMKFMEMQAKGEFEIKIEEAIATFTPDKLLSDGILETAKGTVVEDIVRSMIYGRTILDMEVFESMVQFVRECILLEVHSMMSQQKFDFSALIARSAYSAEIMEGICPIPVFDFSEEDWSALTQSVNRNHSIELLKRLGVHQFFEPPVDQVALRLGENSTLSAHTLRTTADGLSRIGHPVAEPELLSQASNFDELIEKLKSKNYVVEGEYEMQLSENGKQERASVKFRPGEAVFFKLLRAFPGIAQIIGALK